MSLSRMLSSRGNRQLFMLVLFSMASLLFFLYIPHLHGHGHSHEHHFDPDSPSQSLQSISPSLTQMDKCPACFGVDMCNEIKEGNLMIEIPQIMTEAASKGVYFGRWMDFKTKWAGSQVVVKTLKKEAEEFNRFDRFICQNVTKKDKCDVAEAIQKSFMVKPEAWGLENLRHAYKIAHKAPEDLSYAVCSTETLLQALQFIQDMDQDGSLTTEEAAWFYTSLVINPEAVLLNFLGTLEMFHVPRFVGACGRSVVVEDGGEPLGNHLDASWRFRAELSIQILDMINRFMELHTTWAILFSDFSFENFAVFVGDEEIEDLATLVVVDLEDIIVIEKTLAFDEALQEGLDYPCNVECFQRFSKKLYDVQNPEQPQQCVQAGPIGINAMYSLACQNILSDLDEHKRKRPNQDTSNFQKGLLHDIPAESRAELTANIKECVHETAAGRRQEAARKIMDILLTYTVEEEDQEGSDEEV